VPNDVRLRIAVEEEQRRTRAFSQRSYRRPRSRDVFDSEVRKKEAIGRRAARLVATCTVDHRESRFWRHLALEFVLAAVGIQQDAHTPLLPPESLTQAWRAPE